MNWIDALILGLVQGLTEFLPVSSSGHLEIGKALLGIDAEQNLLFTVVVHGATVLSTLVVFYSEILKLIKEGVSFKYNDSTAYILKIILSMIPVLIVGLFFEEKVSSLFDGDLIIVGSMLILTSLLLALTRFIKKDGSKNLPFRDALFMGIAQAAAVMPGLSRSGSTIATGLLLGNKREEVARFSFLMVIIPILGANLLEVVRGDFSLAANTSSMSLIVGFLAAFITGILACKWMINMVKKGNLIYFSLYCLLLGISAIIFA
ncbi:MAG: undecaprenyl-diphosphate phosphatase [Bacteroidales bacterium]|nr:undecaprenyl-diphosphate phosphatase [Bacteroidales bacterium]MCB8998721.1 undecaprenyl-diphosphate phosphatase [Bacteroidales bacterium]